MGQQSSIPAPRLSSIKLALQKKKKKMLVTSSSSKFKAIPEGLEARGCFPATSRCRIQLNGGGGGRLIYQKI